MFQKQNKMYNIFTCPSNFWIIKKDDGAVPSAVKNFLKWQQTEMDLAFHNSSVWVS